MIPNTVRLRGSPIELSNYAVLQHVKAARPDKIKPDNATIDMKC